MKRISLKIALVLLALICCFCVYADGVSEVKNESLKQYLQKLQDYKEEYENLNSQMAEAYKNRDANAFQKARSALYNLSYPILSKEESNAIEQEVVASNDIETANLLYQYSNYYCPKIIFVADSDGFSYSSSISANPGSEVNFPKFNLKHSGLVLKGWGYSKDAVDFEADGKMTMPLSDVTLYAVFEKDPDLNEGKSLEISVKDQEPVVIPCGKLFDFSFAIKNNGTECLNNLEIDFDSDDPLLVVLTEGYSARYLDCYDERSAKFTAITKAKSGTLLNGVITVKDADSVVWTRNVTFKVN